MPTPEFRLVSHELCPYVQSAAICEYLEETAAGPRLHPADPLGRARHRAWMEFASAALNDIAGLYSAADAGAFDAKRGALAAKAATLEGAVDPAGPFFAGARFSLVDAAFGPVFRYFDVFDRFTDLGVFGRVPRVRAWRAAPAQRPSGRG